MTGWVVDGSFALAWTLPDERSAEAERFLGSLDSEEPLHVPALWWSEIANALVTARRRKRITEAEAVQAIELYRNAPLRTVAPDGAESAWRWTRVALEHGLSAYDASYLELALRLGAGLATLDKRLASAARKAGITTAPSPRG